MQPYICSVLSALSQLHGIVEMRGIEPRRQRMQNATGTMPVIPKNRSNRTSGLFSSKWSYQVCMPVREA